MRHDSHLKMLVSGSSRSAMSPRLRSGSLRFSYGYLRVTVSRRTRWLSVRRIPPRMPLTRRPSSPVDVAENDVDRPKDRDDVRDEPASKEPRKDLQIEERGPAHLRPERVGRRPARADHVDADLALRALDRVIGLALRALPDVPEPGPDRPARQPVDALADDLDRAPHLAEADLVARVRVPLRVDDRLHALELRVDRVGPVDPQVPRDPRRAEHRAGEAEALRHVGRDDADADRALEEDLVRLEQLDVVALDVLGVAVEEALELRQHPGREVVEHAPRPEVIEVHP